MRGVLASLAGEHAPGTEQWLDVAEGSHGVSSESVDTA